VSISYRAIGSCFARSRQPHVAQYDDFDLEVRVSTLSIFEREATG